MEYVDVFCQADGQALLPVTEAYRVAFVGWSCEEREAGQRNLKHCPFRIIYLLFDEGSWRNLVFKY